MDMSGTSIIQQRYERNEHYYYPEMQKMISDVIADPNKDINIPDDFISKSLSNTNFLFSIIRRIKIIFQKFCNNVRCFFSGNYREGYKNAVTKIKDAYSTKVATISRISSALMRNKEPIEEAKKKVTALKDKIKLLKEEIPAEQEKLQEKIDAKNLIVHQAKALKEKREYVPTLFERVGTFITTINFWGEKPKVNTEADEIKAADPSFPLDDLTEETINAYENEELETELINDLKQRKVDVLVKEALLTEEETKLEAIRTLLKNAVENIKAAALEVETNNLENFFQDEDLEIPDITEDDVAVVAKELTPQEIQHQTICQDFTNKANKDLGILFSTLLKRLPEDAVSNWQCDEHGNFALKLKQEYHVWMPEPGLTGGAVLMLGHSKDGEIRGKLENNNLYFHSGMNTFVRVPVLGLIAPNFDGIQYHSRTDIRIGGSYLGQSDWKPKNFIGIKKDWANNGQFIVDGNYRKFLEDKVANS